MHVQKTTPMVTTNRTEEVKDFYLKNFDMEVTFEGAGYLGLKARGSAGAELAFMRPEGDCETFGGAGITFSLLVDDVDAEHHRLTARGLEVIRPLQDNPWGDRSFVVADPAGVALYIHTLTAPSAEFAQYVKS